MVDKILAPLDGSELAGGILPYVSRLARGMNARVTLMSVVDPDAVEVPARLEAGRGREGLTVRGYTPETMDVRRTPGDMEAQPSATAYRGGGPYASQIFERVERLLRDRLDEVAERLRGRGVDAECRVVFGKVAEEVVRTAQDEGFGLIAMSTHARTTLGRGILGSVTDRVVHMSRVPVLTVRPEEAEEAGEGDADIKTIIAPLDGSPLAESVLPYVEELADKLQLNVILARVVDVGVFSVPMDGYQYISTMPLDEQLGKESDKYLEEAGERLRARGLSVTRETLWGNPAKRIVELAHETPQSIVAIATHGRSGFARWLLGSVTEKVIRSSGDPVLIVPSPAEA